MQNKKRINSKWLFLLVVPALLVMATGSVLAGRLTDTSKGNLSQANASPLTGAVSAAPVAPVLPDRQVPNPASIDAFALLAPGTGGNCTPPANGGNVLVGCRFVLDLLINAGNNSGDNPEGGVTAHQTYLTFTNQYLNNVRTQNVNASCVLTNILTPVGTYLEANLQNEACNGPAPCAFSGPGTISFSSGTFGALCANGCPDSSDPGVTDVNPFPVARMGLCAVAPGQAVFHWQFSPPEPQTRDSQIIINDGTLVQNRLLYTDYTFCVGPPGSCVAGPSPTLSPTNTVVPTDTPTNTVAPTDTPTSTDTPVNTVTNTPVNTVTNTPVNTVTNTPVNTVTNTPVNTVTNTPVNTVTNTPVNTVTNTPVNTVTNTPVNTVTNTPVNTITNTPVNTVTNTPVNTVTNTPVNTVTNTPVPPTDTRTATNTNTPVPPTDTRTATNTNTPVPPTNTRTATRTNTPVPPTATITNTPAPGTGTATRTRTRTRTATPCDVCKLYFADVNIECNPDGTVHWQAIVRNNHQQCTVNTPYKVQLQRRMGFNGQFQTVAQFNGMGSFPPEDTEIQGDFCYQAASTDFVFYRIYIALDSPITRCNANRLSPFVDACLHPDPCPPSGMAFNDVPADSPIYHSVNGLSSMGAISGYGDGTYRPGATTTRAQLAKIVTIAFGISSAPQGTQVFTDVASDNPFYGYIAAAHSMGLISGYSDGTYRPNESVTRGQVAKIVAMAAVSTMGWELVNPASASFSDVAAGSAYYTYVETALANGAISGYGDGTYRPGETATRGQIARMVNVSATAQIATLPWGAEGQLK